MEAYGAWGKGAKQLMSLMIGHRQQFSEDHAVLRPIKFAEWAKAHMNSAIQRAHSAMVDAALKICRFPRYSARSVGASLVGALAAAAAAAS